MVPGCVWWRPDVSRLLIPLVLSALLSGCGLLTEDVVRLYPEERDAIAAKIGDLTWKTEESWRKAIEELWDVQVAEVRKVGTEVDAKLTTGLTEIGDKLGEGFITRLVNNPGPEGLAAAILFLLGGGVAIKRKRDRLRSRKATPQPEAEGVRLPTVEEIRAEWERLVKEQEAKQQQADPGGNDVLRES